MAEPSMTDKLKVLVADALDTHAYRDKIEWDIGSGMGPDNQHFHFLTFLAPSPILGDTIMATGMIAGANTVTGEQIAILVQNALAQIRKARSERLSAELPKQHQAGALIVP